MVGVHFGLMLEESHGVVHVVHFHLQSGVLIHAADAAGGLEATVVKAHAHIAELGHLAGKHGRINLVQAGPAGVGNDAGTLLAVLVVIRQVNGTYHLGTFAVEDYFTLLYNQKLPF